jgi:glycerol-3-phosphate dehydrogenase (NAD(P)+)
MADHVTLRVGIVGLGNLGTAIGNLAAANGCDVVGWEINADVVAEVNRQHSNSRFLPGVALSPRLVATHDLHEVFHHTRVVFIALPSRFIQPTLQPVRDAGKVAVDTVVVNMAKGIDAFTGLTAFQTVSALFPMNPCVMLSGPSIANEFALGMPTVVVLAGQDPTRLMQVAHVLDARHFRTRFSEDAMGVELGGVLKNIYAIGLGLFDGRDIRSVNFRSVYLTIALEEMTRIGVAMGAQAETFAYLAGLGDLLATSLSEHSHNRRLGEYLSQGLPLDEIQARMGVLPEGFNTLKVVLDIAEKLHVSLPLAKGLWDVIHGRFEAERFIFSFVRDFVD